MGIEADFVRPRAVVEVKYEEGLVYLDCCGSLTNSLCTALGPGFSFDLPTVRQAELKNDAERLLLRYGSDTMSVTQDCIASVTRFKEVSDTSWKTVSHALKVSSKVTRVGVRLWYSWEVADAQEAETAIANSGLVAESGTWNTIFGKPISNSVTAISKVPGWKHQRIALAVASIRVDGELPERIEKYYPPHAVSLDVDLVFHDAGRTQLQPQALNTLIFDAWKIGEELAIKVGERLNQ